jgi:hypothetical protein
VRRKNEEKKMKKSTLITVLLALFAAVGILASCSTPSKAAKAAESIKPTQKVEVLEDKGTAFGLSAPVWVTTYITDGGNIAVQNLPEYKGKYCYVIEGEDTSKDYAITWASNPANGARAVAEKISTTVSATATAKLEGEKGEGVQSRQKQAAEALSNANFSGLSKNGDWWQIVHNLSTDVTTTRAFALYVIDQKTLNDQVASYIANFVNLNNAAMSEAERSIYKDLIEQIRSAGGVNS